MRLDRRRAVAGDHLSPPPRESGRCEITHLYRHCGSVEIVSICPFKPAGWRPGMRTRRVGPGAYEIVALGGEAGSAAGGGGSELAGAAEPVAGKDEAELARKALENRRRVQREYQRRKRAREKGQ